MTIEKIKAIFDACYLAKRSRDLLPPLPKGVTPSYIHYLDVIESFGQQGVSVKVSDISDALDIPRPGVTRTVKEMQAKGYLRKQTSESDGRVTYITVTEDGKNYPRYIIHSILTDYFRFLKIFQMKMRNVQ